MIPKSLLPKIGASGLDVSTPDSVITKLRLSPNSGLTLGYTGAEPGTGLVTIGLAETGVDTKGSGLGLYKIQVDKFGRVTNVVPATINYGDLENRPDVPALVENRVQLAIQQLNIPDIPTLRDIISKLMVEVQNDLKSYIDQRLNNININTGGLSEAAVAQMIKVALEGLQLPANWTADGIINVIKNAISSGAITLPNATVNLSTYFNSQEGNTMLTTIVQTVVAAILPDFLRQWFIDNPLDKPDCHLFACGYPSSGTVSGQVANQPQSYKYGENRLVAAGQPPNGDVQFVLRKNGNPVANLTLHADGTANWGDSGTLLLQFTDVLSLTTTDMKGASAVMVTLANANASVVDTTETITIPGTVAGPNNILHTIVPANLNGAIVWMLLLPFDATIDLLSFKASTSRAVSATPAAFKLWKGSMELPSFTFEVGATTAGVSNRAANTVNGSRGELVFIQCQSASDMGTLIHNLDIKPVDSVPGDFTMSGGYATSLNPVELFRYIALSEVTIDMQRAVFSAVVADPVNQSLLYARVDGVGKSAIRFAANAKTGVLTGDRTITIPAGGIFTLEGATTTNLQGLSFSLIGSLTNQPAWLKQEFNASYVGDAPRGAVIAADLVEANRVIDLTKSKAKLSSPAAGGFALTVRRNGVSVATVTFNSGAVDGVFDTEPGGGTTVPVTVGDIVDVVASTGTATRPSVNFAYT